MSFGRLGSLGRGFGAFGSLGGAAASAAWWFTTAAEDSDFANSRYHLIQLSDYSVSRASQEIAANAAGTQFAFADDVPAITDQGLQAWEARTNKCTNYNANPQALVTPTSNKTTFNAAVTNMTAGNGDANTKWGVVDDPAAIAAAGLQNICNGRAYQIDNTLGAAVAVIDIGGLTGNTNPHTVSFFARGSGATQLRWSNNSGITGALAITSSYTRFSSANLTPPATTIGLRVYVPAGAIVYFILNKLEEATFIDPPVITAGASGTRAADLVTRSLAGTAMGAIYFKATTAAVSGTQTLFQWDKNDGTTNDSIVVYRDSSNQIHAVFTSGGVTQADLIAATVANSTSFQLGLSWATDNFQVSVNGGAPVVDLSGTVPSGLTTMRFGSAVSTNWWNSFTARFARWDDNIVDVQAISQGNLSGGTAPVAPTEFSGLSRWYSAAAITGVLEGAGVASWPDRSTANDPAVQATGGLQPTYSATSASGKAGVTWTGGQVLNFTGLTDTQTIVVVGSLTNPQTNDYGPLLGDATATDLTGGLKTLPWLIDTSSVPSAKQGATVWMNGKSSGPLDMMCKPSSLSVFVIRMPSGQTGSFANLGLDRAASKYISGVFAEYALFNRILTDVETAEVTKYFTNFYGITSNSNPTYPARANSKFVGDSMTSGQGATLPYPTQLATDLGGGTSLAVTNLGRSGTDAVAWVSTYWDTDLYKYGVPRINNTMSNPCHIWLGTNDLYHGYTVAQTFSALQTLWARARALGMPVIAYTILSRGTVGTPANFDTLRGQLNTLIRGASSEYDYLVDVAADATIGPDGAWSNPTYFQADNTHLTNAGLAIVATLSQAAYTALGL